MTHSPTPRILYWNIKAFIPSARMAEKHAWNPDTISMLQLATRLGSYKKFKEYSHTVDEKESSIFLRDFLTFKRRTPIPLEQVEPEEAIMRRFVTGSDELRFYQPGSARDDGYGHEQDTRTQ